MTQAYRDFCSSDEELIEEISKWIVSPDFIEVCDDASVSPERALEAFVSLARLDVHVRREVILDTISKVMGGKGSLKS